MSKGRKNRKKAKKLARKHLSRNSIRRREYAKRNLEEKEEARKMSPEEQEVVVINPDSFKRPSSLDRAYDEVKSIGRDSSRYNYDTGESYYARIKRLERESLLRRSTQVILERGYRGNVGDIFLWRLDKQIPEKCDNYTYAIKGTGLPKFIVQAYGRSRVFAEQSHSDEERDKMLYQEALKQAQRFAEQHKKEFIDATRENDN